MNQKDQNNKPIIFYALTSLLLICIIGTITFVIANELSSIKENMPVSTNEKKDGTNNLITANVDVKLKTKTFEISCDKLEISNNIDNNEYDLVSFHINLKNLTNQKIILQDNKDFYCSVSNKLQTNITDKDTERKKLSKAVNQNEKTDGYVTFKVPKDTKVYELKYEDALLHIELLNNKNAN